MTLSLQQCLRVSPQPGWIELLVVVLPCCPDQDEWVQKEMEEFERYKRLGKFDNLNI